MATSDTNELRLEPYKTPPILVGHSGGRLVAVAFIVFGRHGIGDTLRLETVVDGRRISWPIPHLPQPQLLGKWHLRALMMR